MNQKIMDFLIFLEMHTNSSFYLFHRHDADHWVFDIVTGKNRKNLIGPNLQDLMKMHMKDFPAFSGMPKKKEEKGLDSFM